MKTKHLPKRILCLALAAVLSLTAFGAALASFAVTAAASSAKEPNYYDFSEMNMATNTSRLEPNGLDFEPGDGGNAARSGSYLASWDGAVPESADPYDGYSDNFEHKELDSVIHIDGIVTIKNTVDAVKQGLVDYGALYCRFMTGDYFSDNAVNYYSPLISAFSGSHAVAIVGWDDFYSRYNFVRTPRGDGAFICKNSWGTESGEDGYFYISYYDSTLLSDSYADINAFIAPDSEKDYNKIYQYDELGAVGATKKLYDTISYVANVFPENGATLASAETLKAVSFYTTEENVNYSVYILDYKDKADMNSRINSNNCLYTQSGTVASAGYHVIDLDTDVALAAGIRFAVAIKLTDAKGKTASYVCEAPMEDYSSAARSAKRESYYSAAGMCFDLYDERDNFNWCIKAFTQYTPSTAKRSPAKKYFAGVGGTKRVYDKNTVYKLSQLINMGIDFNPAFVTYMSDTAAGGDVAPSPLKVTFSPADVQSGLPSKFDLRDYGLVSPVRDQGNLGTCWAFATLASLESSALKKCSAANGDGVYPGAKELKFRTDTSANITSAGQELVYKLTAPANDEYLVSVTGTNLVTEIRSAFGVTLERQSGNSLAFTLRLKKDERVFICISGDVGSATLRADVDYLLDPDEAVALNPGDTFSDTTDAYRFDVYKITNSTDDIVDCRVTISSADRLAVTVIYDDGETDTVIIEGSDYLNAYLYIGQCQYICIRPFSGATASYSLNCLTNLDYYNSLATPITETDADILMDTADNKGIFSFTPSQDGYYDAIGDGFYYCLVFDDKGEEVAWYDAYSDDGETIVGDPTKHDYRELKSGKKYFFHLYEVGGEVNIRIVRWRENLSSTAKAIETGRVYSEPIIYGGDAIKFTFTAAESGNYRFYVKNLYYENEVTLTNAAGTTTGTKFTPDATAYIYDSVPAGETRTLSVRIPYETKFRDSVTLGVVKCDEDSFTASAAAVTAGTAATGTASGLNVLKFTPAESGNYLFTNAYKYDVNYTVTDSNGAPLDIKYFYTVSPDTKTRVYALEGGKTYYTAVEAGTRGVGNEYSLTVESAAQVALRNRVSISPGVMGTGTVLTSDDKVNVVYNNGDTSLAAAGRIIATVRTGASPSDIHLTCDGNEAEFAAGYDWVWDDYGICTAYFEIVPDNTDVKSITIEMTGEMGYEFEILIETVPIEEDEPMMMFLKDTVTMSVGSKRTFTCFTDYGDSEVVWSSSDESVATVDNMGRVKAVSLGVAKITVKSTDGKAETSMSIYVKHSIWQRILMFILSLFRGTLI